MFRIGTDICSIVRIAAAWKRQGHRFLMRLMADEEMEIIQSTPEARRLPLVAGRFAGKEAIAKALGTGIGPVSWRELAVVRLSSGEPSVKLTGAAASIARDMRLDVWQISISHEETYAVAFVIAHQQGL